MADDKTEKPTRGEREPDEVPEKSDARGAWGAAMLGLAMLGGAYYALTEYTGGSSGPSTTDAGSASDGAAAGDAGADAAVEGQRDPARAAALAPFDERIRAAERAARRRDDSWLPWQVLANRYLDRARASGDWNDYRRAEDALERAFEIAPERAGPHDARAAFNYSMHRLARVVPDLDAIDAYAVVTADQRALVASLRADVAFHSGRYDEARAMYEANLEAYRGPERLAALAQWHWKTADFARAEALLAEAGDLADRAGGSTAAWICLVRGLYALDRGRWDDALQHYRRGLGHSPGDWLLEEHIAEILTLRGDDVIALPMYEHLVEETGSPEFMDAIAGILHEHGDHEGSIRWAARAREAWEERIALYPEAAYGHALDHWLELERDPERTIEMARANVEARPNGESKTKLAEAYVAAGRTAEAKRTIDEILAGPWRTADLHAIAVRIHEAMGDAAAAATARRAALAINPHAFD